MSFGFLANRSFDRLHTWRLCEPMEMQCRAGISLDEQILRKWQQSPRTDRYVFDQALQ